MSEKDLALITKIINLNKLTFQEVHGALLKIVDKKAMAKKKEPNQMNFSDSCETHDS